MGRIASITISIALLLAGAFKFAYEMGRMHGKRDCLIEMRRTLEDAREIFKK